MIKASLLLCSIAAVHGIIVTDPPPSETDYKYSYNIEDPSTGDSKSQHEVRRGDVVTGAYTVVGPDGTKRTVEYTADSKHGFNAVLREEPPVETKQTQNFNTQISQSLDSQYTAYLQKPIYLQKLPLPYAKKNQDIVLFTPENEIKSDRSAFVHGKYFEPAAK